MKQHLLTALAAVALLAGCATSSTPLPLRGTGDLGVVVERATGTLQTVERSARIRLACIAGLGDLTHASVVFSRDLRHSSVFSRDGRLTKVHLLLQHIDKRILQAGKSTG